MVHIVLFLAFFLTLLARGKYKYLQYIAFALLFVFAAIRYMYGNDYKNYMTMFDMVHRGVSLNDGEPLFELLCKVMPSFYVLIAVTSGFFVFTIYRLITKNLPTNYVWIGMFLFVYNTNLFVLNLSSIRQCIAMCVFLHAVNMAYERKPLHYVLLVVVAAMFHKILWTMLPLYFLLTDKPVKNWQVIVILLGVATVVALADLQSLAQNVLSVFNDKNYMHYSNLGLHNSLRATILTTLFFFYILFNLRCLEGKMLVYGKLYLLSTVLGLFAYRMTMFGRLQMLFEIVSVVVLPVIMLKTRERGPIIINYKNVLLTVWECVNKFVLPWLLLVIIVLRYYSFFIAEIWEPFFHYDTIFSLL